MRWFTDVSVWSEKPDVVQVFNSSNECFDYVPERTCNVSEGKDQRKGWWICSECDTPFDMIGALAIMNKKKPMYCPGCGAKVVR